MADPYVVEALDLGLRTLELFFNVDVMTVTDVAEALQIPRSRAHRILSTLEHRGFVARAEGGRGYEAGAVMLSMARPALPTGQELAHVRALADRSSAAVGETVHVTLLVGSRLLFSYGATPKADLPPARAVVPGATRPAHATTAGKLLLSYLSEQQIRSLFPAEVLPRYTHWTVPTTSRLIEETVAIRETGMAKSYRESLVGLAGVAVVAGGASWRDRIALAASIPMERADDRYLEQVGRRLMLASRDQSGDYRSTRSTTH